jgi:hypothetical protein
VVRGQGREGATAATNGAAGDCCGIPRGLRYSSDAERPATAADARPEGHCRGAWLTCHNDSDVVNSMV